MWFRTKQGGEYKVNDEFIGSSELLPLQEFYNKFKVCLPIGYEVKLLPRNINDVACDWRRFEIKFNDKKIELGITSENYSLNFKEISKKFIEPACEYLNPKPTLRIKLPNDYIVTSGEKKMTREEAVKKVTKDTEGFYTDKFVKALEALGLIKFEEEVELSDDAEICLRTNVKDRAVYSTLGAMKDAVGCHGYKIVKA